MPCHYRNPCLNTYFSASCMQTSSFLNPPGQHAKTVTWPRQRFLTFLLSPSSFICSKPSWGPRYALRMGEVSGLEKSYRHLWLNCVSLNYSYQLSPSICWPATSAPRGRTLVWRCLSLISTWMWVCFILASLFYYCQGHASSVPSGYKLCTISSCKLFFQRYLISSASRCHRHILHRTNL